MHCYVLPWPACCPNTNPDMRPRHFIPQPSPSPPIQPPSLSFCLPIVSPPRITTRTTLILVAVLGASAPRPCAACLVVRCCRPQPCPTPACRRPAPACATHDCCANMQSMPAPRVNCSMHSGGGGAGRARPARVWPQERTALCAGPCQIAAQRSHKVWHDGPDVQMQFLEPLRGTQLETERA